MKQVAEGLSGLTLELPLSLVLVQEPEEKYKESCIDSVSFHSLHKAADHLPRNVCGLSQVTDLVLCLTGQQS